MQVSTLIQLLQTLQQTHGDLPVSIDVYNHKGSLISYKPGFVECAEVGDLDVISIGVNPGDAQ